MRAFEGSARDRGNGAVEQSDAPVNVGPGFEGMVEIHIDGRAVSARVEQTLAAALLDAGITAFRRSVTGSARGPLCGMGICHECQVTIDGSAHRRACLEPVVQGMRVSTGD